VVDAGGDATYKSVLIVRKGSKITLDDVLKCEKKLNFGIGDAESTSGTLAPLTYLFTPRAIEPAKCFKTVRSANHQANFMGVANGVLDVATNNTVGLVFYQRENPELAARVETIWTSPPLPESSILVRKDLDPALKEKIRQFFLTYGTGTGPQADKQREVLKGLAYGGFKPADDSYLDPIREMVAGQELADARRGGDKARIAAAQAKFDKVQAAAAQRRAANPDI
jgi:phosphonate transport system substrate-binding protein